MASLPAMIIDQLLLRPLEELLSRPGPFRMRLRTGRRLARVDLVTEPSYLREIIYVQPGVTEVRFEDLPACTILGFDYYDQDGVCFMRTRYARTAAAGDAATAPVIVSIW